MTTRVNRPGLDGGVNRRLSLSPVDVGRQRDSETSITDILTRQSAAKVEPSLTCEYLSKSMRWTHTGARPTSLSQFMIIILGCSSFMSGFLRVSRWTLSV